MVWIPVFVDLVGINSFLGEADVRLPGTMISTEQLLDKRFGSLSRLRLLELPVRYGNIQHHYSATPQITVGSV